MTPIDYCIIALLIVSAGFGFVRGFFREIVTVASWIAGLWLASRGTGYLEPYIVQWFADPFVRKASGADASGGADRKSHV